VGVLEISNRENRESVFSVERLCGFGRDCEVVALAQGLLGNRQAKGSWHSCL
jgi:hypothetical protein